MSDDVSLTSTNEDDIIEDARKRFKRCQDWERTARDNFISDIKFAEGDTTNGHQWPADIARARQIDARPCLTNNLVRQHCLQIVNDARQNKPGIEIRATGDGATYEAAKVFEGLCRHIEYASDAQTAYGTASYHQVYGGWGYLRVVTDYADEDSFDQDIFIRRVPDPMAVYLDPDIQTADGSDAAFGFVFTDMEKRAFDEAHPDLKDETGEAAIEASHGWVSQNHVRVADYYRKVEKADWLIALPDGSTVKQSELPPELRDQVKAAGLQRRKLKRTVIEQYKLAGSRVIARTVWPGKYVPIARVIGEETVIDGQMDRKGHARAMISAQQMMNYFYSAAVEHVALQGKTPWVGPMEAFEGYEEYWSTANTVNHAWLPYKSHSDDGKPLERPERAQPPAMAQAFIQGLNVSSQLIMDVSGQHQANLGEPSNEKSGVAIQQRQRQGDNATAHYIDRQAQAIRFVGRILIDLIPKVYDTTRVVQILAQDGSQQMVQVDPQAQQPHQQVQDHEAKDYDPASVAAIFNPNVGKYSVVADIGPSFATKRQDAFNAFMQLIQANNGLMDKVGDLMFKNADFPDADEVAKRLRKAVPQQLLTDGPPPEVLQLQQQLKAVQGEAEQRIVHLQQQVNDAQAKLGNQSQDKDTAEFRAQTERLKVVGDIDPDTAKVLVRNMTEAAVGGSLVPLLAHDQSVEQALAPVPQQPPATDAQPALPPQDPTGGHQPSA